MRDDDATVRTYTVIDPKNRINDPTKGTILVSVLGGSGAGSAGVTVTATPASPANGATALAKAPLPTDAQGCTYILKVTPGNYNVTVSRAGYVDVAQNATSTITHRRRRRRRGLGRLPVRPGRDLHRAVRAGRHGPVTDHPEQHGDDVPQLLRRAPVDRDERQS